MKTHTLNYRHALITLGLLAWTGVGLAVALGLGGCASKQGPQLPAPIRIELEQAKPPAPAPR